MDKNNDYKLPDANPFDEAETKKNLVNARIRKAQTAVQNAPKPGTKKTSKNKKNPVAPSPNAKSPAVSPVRKNEAAKTPMPRQSQEPTKNKKSKTITETEDEDDGETDRKFIKFIEQVSFIENATSLNTYYSTHLLNLIQPIEPFEAFTRNTPKNRNPDVICIDKTRVKLTDPCIEYYIHANHIKFDRLTKTYIATQHPLPGTLNDFWAMITDQKVDVIVSLTNVTPNTNVDIFPIYYPNKPDTFRNFGQFYIYCKSVTPPKTKYGSTEYKLELVAQCDKEEKHKIRLYHYQHWIKNTVPASTKVVLDVVTRLGKKRSRGPIVVQCETGVNQSAEVIYVDAMCTMLANGVEANFDTLFRQMRKQRAKIMTQRLHFLHSISTVLDFIKNSFIPIPAALVSQMMSIMFSISRDFQYNMSVEPTDATNPLKSPTMAELGY